MSPRVMLNAVKPRMAGAWSRCGDHTTNPPQAQGFSENPLEFQVDKQSELPQAPKPHHSIPRHWDTGLAPGCLADEEETNSIPWTREPFAGEVQLLPEKSQKARAGNSTALIFNNSLV